MVELATLLEVLVMIGVPIVVARAIRARYALSWGAFAIGGAAFMLSQVGHVPFNALVTPHLPAASAPSFLWVAAIFYGLSAGCFEELSRYAAMRWVMKDQRTGAHALAYGAGHGGIESAILGGMLALTLFNIVVIESTGVEHLGLDATALSTVRQQIAAFDHAGVTPHLLGALERLCTIPFHIAASTLVMRAVVERRARWLVLAIGYHALVDGSILPVRQYFGAEALELLIVGTVPVSLLTIALSMRALPKIAMPAAQPEASGAPVEVVDAEKH